MKLQSKIIYVGVIFILAIFSQVHANDFQGNVASRDLDDRQLNLFISEFTTLENSKDKNKFLDLKKRTENYYQILQNRNYDASYIMQDTKGFLLRLDSKIATLDKNREIVQRNIICADLKYNNVNFEQYQKNMDKMALLAHLPDGDWNKYHESIVSNLCKYTPEDIQAIDAMVDYGSITARDAEAMAKIFGRNYQAPPRTEKGKMFEKINNELANLELCLACAANIADEYVKNPTSKFAKLIDTALSGDKTSLDTVKSIPTSNAEEVSAYAMNLQDTLHTSNKKQKIDDKQHYQKCSLAIFFYYLNVTPSESCLYSYASNDFPLQAAQVTSGGIMVKIGVPVGYDRLIYIYNDNKLENSLVDDSIIPYGYFVFAGKYTYISVLGGEKSVYSFRRVLNPPFDPPSQH